MTFISGTVKKGAVGLQDVMNAVTEVRHKARAAALEKQIASYQAAVDFGKIFERHAVGLEPSRAGYQSPDQVPGWNGQRLFDIDDCMRHDDAVLADGQPRFRTPAQKTVEPDEYVFSQVRFNDFRPMSGHIKTFQARIDNIAIFLGIGAPAKPCILKISALGNQDILADTGFGFDDRIAIQGSAGGNRNGRTDVDDVKDTLEGFFAIFHKIHDEPPGCLAFKKIDVIVQPVEGVAVEKIECAGIADPHRSGANIKMGNLAGLHVRKRSDHTIPHGGQINGCTGSQETPV